MPALSSLSRKATRPAATSGGVASRSRALGLLVVGADHLPVERQRDVVDGGGDEAGRDGVHPPARLLLGEVLDQAHRGDLREGVGREARERRGRAAPGEEHHARRAAASSSGAQAWITRKVPTRCSSSVVARASRSTERVGPTGSSRPAASTSPSSAPPSALRARRRAARRSRDPPGRAGATWRRGPRAPSGDPDRGPWRAPGHRARATRRRSRPRGRPCHPPR